MVDKARHQQNPRPVRLADLVETWLKLNKPHASYKLERDSFWANGATRLDIYGWWFSIYEDYLSAGMGQAQDGSRYDTGFLIDASDPEFFAKLKAKLDDIENTYPERHAALLKAASDAVARMESAKRLGLSTEEQLLDGTDASTDTDKL